MTDNSISPLRQRMIQDMTVRGFSAGTQRGYITAVRSFSVFLGRSPDQAGVEDLRCYQLHMRSIGATASSMNAAVSALRFFFGVTLGRSDAQAGMTTVRIQDTCELHQNAVAHQLDCAAAMLRGFGVYQFSAMGLQCSERTGLVFTHKARVANHIGGKDGG